MYSQQHTWYRMQRCIVQWSGTELVLALLGVPLAPCSLLYSKLRKQANNVRMVVSCLWCGPGNVHGCVLGGRSYRQGWANDQKPNEPVGFTCAQSHYFRVRQVESYHRLGEIARCSYWAIVLLVLDLNNWYARCLMNRTLKGRRRATQYNHRFFNCKSTRFIWLKNPCPSSRTNSGPSTPCANFGYACMSTLKPKQSRTSESQQQQE